MISLQSQYSAKCSKSAGVSSILEFPDNSCQFQYSLYFSRFSAVNKCLLSEPESSSQSTLFLNFSIMDVVQRMFLLLEISFHDTLSLYFSNICSFHANSLDSSFHAASSNSLLPYYMFFNGLTSILLQSKDW